MLGAGERIHAWAEALARMDEALVILDVAGGADDVGAHLDLAICRLHQIGSGSLAIINGVNNTVADARLWPPSSDLSPATRMP